jgi:signal transduction histidine kinase
MMKLPLTQRRITQIISELDQLGLVTSDVVSKGRYGRKEFIDIAAHELKNPIQPILALSQLLLSKTGNIEQYNELLEPICRNAERLNRLAEDILDLTPRS